MQNNKARQNWRRENLFIRKITFIMNQKSEKIINLIFEKLKNYKNKKIFLEKENLKKFVLTLFEEN